MYRYSIPTQKTPRWFAARSATLPNCASAFRSAWPSASIRPSTPPLDVRRLTNLGTFRAYVRQWLRQHPKVHQDLTLLVRQLPPGPEGLPIEIYCFTTTTDWNAYEDIQGDIFDHFLAIVPEFGLRLYQKPAGNDMAAALADSAD